MGIVKSWSCLVEGEMIFQLFVITTKMILLRFSSITVLGLRKKQINLEKLQAKSKYKTGSLEKYRICEINYDCNEK